MFLCFCCRAGNNRVKKIEGDVSMRKRRGIIRKALIVGAMIRLARKLFR
ncbi:MAG: hypothetical protein N2484_12485 [Clostridia bacterium]|nr:hypothetical protein [Clostridia bacterium]